MGVPPPLRFAELRASAGSGLLRGTLRSRAPLRFAPLPMVAPYASLTRANAPAALILRKAAQVGKCCRDDLYNE
ncbi:MAG: hypothetical protein RML37_05555 [Chitinophagales bacterium]|nr:hypothetical protein [Chitinophagales bacterium]